MYQLKFTSPEQLDSVAVCHVACFPDSFGSKIGFVYTKKSLEWFIAGSNRFLFHAEKDNKVVGYCGGFQPMRPGEGSTSGMMQFAMRESIIGMFRKPWLFFHKDILRFYPLIFKNIYRKYLFRPTHTQLESKRDEAIQIGLVVIGVHPDYRGKGCFDMLMKHFEQECIQRHARKMILSVKATNARAIAAYKKCGWETANITDIAVEMYKLIPVKE